MLRRTSLLPPMLAPMLAGLLACCAPGIGHAQGRAVQGAAAPMPASPQADAASIVAVVNGDVISREDVDARRRLFALSAGLPESPEVLARLTPQITHQLIDEKLRLQEMQRRRIVVSDQDIARAIGEVESRNSMPPGTLQRRLKAGGVGMRTLIDQIRVQIGWTRVLREVLGPQAQVSDADIADQMAALKAEVGHPEYQVGEIFIPVENPQSSAEAQKFADVVIQQLHDGAPFAVAAAQFSQSQTALAGGDLGWVQPENLDPAVAAILAQMPVGAVSNPIRVPGGIDIVTLRGKPLDRPRRAGCAGHAPGLHPVHRQAESAGADRAAEAGAGAGAAPVGHGQQLRRDRGGRQAVRQRPSGQSRPGGAERRAGADEGRAGKAATRPRQSAAGGRGRHRRGDGLLARDQDRRPAVQGGYVRPHPGRADRAGIAPVAARAGAPRGDRATGLNDSLARPRLRDVIARHGLDARRSLGQHFLLDANLCARVARQAGDLAGRHVVEVGPGPGGLTRALLDGPARSVTAVELDARAVAALAELAGEDPARLRVIEGDALALDLAGLVSSPRQIVANLPYNIASPLLVGLLRQAAAWERMTLMFQQEVAERICAAPDTAAYGRLSVLAQFLCAAEFCFRIPPEAFAPPPKVWSAVVTLTPHAIQPSPAIVAAMERLTAAAFGQRRKMLRGSLRALGGMALLERAGIAGERRAETLGIAEFATLAGLLAA